MAISHHRPRRLRSSKTLRNMVRETRLCPEQLIQPLFVTETTPKPIKSMPGVAQFTLKDIAKEAASVYKSGVPAVILFGIPRKKDERATGGWAANGIVQNAVRAIKDKVPELLVITDVCLCEYTSHGHCGMVKGREGNQRTGAQDFVIDNDSSLEILSDVAVSHAIAGADMVAPSDMMDGRVRAIRSALDGSGFSDVSLMSYAVKYASAFYGPFREAAGSAPQFGDRKTYQMDAGNIREALREAKLDAREGADILMVKPALSYLDVISKVKAVVDLPIAAYQVSGEYAMIKAGVEKGWVDEKSMILETLLSIKRAGADLIVTYFAKEAVKSIFH